MTPRSSRRDESEPRSEPRARPAGIVRRAFGHGSAPEQELERLLHERRGELEEYAARFEETALELGRREERLRDERASVERLLRRSTAELEAREQELIDFERELRARDERLSAAEESLARRRGDLGAVELMRAALERREQAVESREAAIASRESRGDESTVRAGGADAAVELLFVPGPAYRLAGLDGRALAPGSTVEVDDEEYTVLRIGRSPLPGDERQCAYLVRGAPRVPGPGGSL